MIGPVWLWARSDLRRRWRGAAVIALVLGAFGAFALTALFGARRADTVWERFRVETLAPDSFVSVPSRNDPAATKEILRLPGVAAAGGFVYLPLAPEATPSGGAFAAADDQFGRTVYRPRILAGRRADPSKVNEVTVNPAMAGAVGLGPGDPLTLVAQDGSGFSLNVTVVGVHLGTTDVSLNATFPSALLTPAFLAAHSGDVEVGRLNQFVRLVRSDAGVEEFRRAATDHFGSGGGVLVGGAREEESGITDALGVQAFSLGLVAAAAAAATLVAVGQALARHTARGLTDARALGSLGMTFAQRLACALPTVLLVAATGSVLAAAASYAASPLVPGGLARQIEPHRGRTFDALAVVGGAVALTALVALLGVLLAARSARWTSGRPAPGPTGARGLPVWLGPSAVVGVRNATGAGAPRARLIARSTVVAAVLGVLSVAGAATFAASLDHLTDTPKLYGWDFDVLVGVGGEDPDQIVAAADALSGDAEVDRLALVEVGFLNLGEANVETLVLDHRKGRPIHPPLPEGRPPIGPGEISLGSTTLRRLGAKVGDKIRAQGVTGMVELTVVGRGVYPVLGDGTITDAASIDVAAVAALRLEVSRGRFVMAGVVEGRDPTAVVRRHTQLFPGLPIPPSEVTNLRQVGSSPWVLAAFLASLALAAVGHALVLSVRAGRRDFAVLRALGFARRQIGSSLCWQASAVMLLALVGIPIGVAAGRWLWTTVARETGAVVETVIPVPLLALLVAGGFAAANVIAVVPGQAAARMPPSEVLREE